MNWLQRILNLIGLPVTSLSADLEAVNDVTDDIVAVTAALPDAGALTSIAQADTLSLDIQGAGWATETLFAIQAAIEAIGGATAQVVTITLHVLINDVLTAVDPFTIDGTNFGTYFSLVDMFGKHDLTGDNLKVTAALSAGATTPIAVTGQYQHSLVYTA